MATYVSPPGPRMDYGADGTSVVAWLHPDFGAGFIGNIGPSQITVSELTSTQVASLNKENLSGVVSMNDDNNQTSFLCFIFPEPRTILGYFANRITSGDPASFFIATSTDTTNGTDGIWTTRLTVSSGAQLQPASSSTDDAYRSLVTGVTWLSTKGVRLQSSGGIGGAFGTATTYSRVHWYGTSVPAGGRLHLWHPTLDQEVSGTYLDEGDTPRSSSLDIPVRFKNNHTTKSATNVMVQFLSSTTESSPSSIYQHYISEDGVSFYGYVTIPSIGPGQVTDLYYVRRVVPSDAATDKPYVTKLVTSGTWV